MDHQSSIAADEADHTAPWCHLDPSTRLRVGLEPIVTPALRPCHQSALSGAPVIGPPLASPNWRCRVLQTLAVAWTPTAPGGTRCSNELVKVGGRFERPPPP